MEPQIQEHWLTARTGDPFADAGGLVIDFLCHLPRFRNSPIADVIAYVADIYIDTWDAKLHPFFLNSTITQAQFTGDRKRTETLKYFDGLINSEEGPAMGYCEITGRKTRLFPAGRNNQILAGSGTFVNYHANLRPGIYLCKEMLIRMFFVPLGVQRLADKLALVVSNNEQVQRFFVYQNLIHNLDALKNGGSKGPLKSAFRNPANALFRFVDHYTAHLQKNLQPEDNASFVFSPANLDLYLFSNLGQKPEIVTYTLDAESFHFYTFCQSNYSADWQAFVVRHYSPDNYAKSVFDEQQAKWITKEDEEITFEEYERWRNFVLNGLLHKLSLTKYFLNWSSRHFLPLDIIKNYYVAIRKMKKGAIEKVEALADLILAQEGTYAEDMIKELNSAMSRPELRKIFITLQELAYKARAKDAILTAAEYIEHLVPPGSVWTELRDVFIICIYQKRHLKNV
jgi:CRISPR-associated protein Cst1